MCETGLDRLVLRAIIDARASMFRRICSLILLVLLAAAPTGCGSDTAGPLGQPTLTGGQTGGEAGLNCSSDVAITRLYGDEASPLGFTAADVLAAVPERSTASLTWSDGATSVLSVELAGDGSAGYAERCAANAVAVRLQLQSADGALDETLHGEVFARAPERAWLTIEVPIADVQSSGLQSRARAVGAHSIEFAVVLTSAGASGTITGLGAAEASAPLASF